MTARELLELAAKAAGLPAFWDESLGSMRLVNEASGNWSIWRPIHDDGDALRLAVKLKLDVWIGIDGTTVAGVDCEESECNGDPYAATRRAIVRAAAELGKEKA